jgi:hypothetical protein
VGVRLYFPGMPEPVHGGRCAKTRTSERTGTQDPRVGEHGAPRVNRNGTGVLVALSHQAMTDEFLLARIIKRTEVAENLWTIRVDPGAPFSFAAGQYATLGVLNGQHLVERAYSIPYRSMRSGPQNSLAKSS